MSLFKPGDFVYIKSYNDLPVDATGARNCYGISPSTITRLSEESYRNGGFQVTKVLDDTPDFERIYLSGNVYYWGSHMLEHVDEYNDDIISPSEDYEFFLGG